MGIYQHVYRTELAQKLVLYAATEREKDSRYSYDRRDMLSASTHIRSVFGSKTPKSSMNPHTTGRVEHKA